MSKVIAIIVIFAVVIWFFIALMWRRKELNANVKNYFGLLGDSLKKMNTPHLLRRSDVVRVAKFVLYCVGALCVLILATTGFIPYALGSPISGFLLILHVSVSPVFAVCVVLLTLLLAHGCAFGAEYPARSGIVKPDEDPNVSIPRYGTATKILFWLIVLLSLFVISSIILSMYPLMGTHGQELLLVIHRVSAVLFFIISILHAFYLFNSPVSMARDE